MEYNSEEQVIRLCLEKLSAQYGRKIIVERKHPVGGGCINSALRLKCNAGDFFLKWNSSCPADMFLKEAAGLQEIHSVGISYLRIPEIIWAKETDELPGVLLMEYLQPSDGSSEQDEKLGLGLAMLHRKTAPGYGFYHDNYCGLTVQKNTWNTNWIEFFGQQRLLYLLHMVQHSRGISSEEIKIFEKFIDRLPEILSHPTAPSLIHGDLWSGNYMYTAGGPSLIDPAAYYADREMELSIMTMFGGFSSRVWAAYQEAFPLSDGWKERNRVYQLYHLLNHYYLFGGSYLDQANRIVRQFI
ncbi:MAG: fructosamine kinase family protein [Prolixibacteraceae bacterium]|jgi:fructosamine-3-kinase|nr:fructosamine kinase family protein [Prolixibacteraceae bacterium]